MRVMGLFVYPLKSGREVPLDRMSVDALGPFPDRRWMVVDEHGDMITQRTHPQLALVGAHYVNDHMWGCHLTLYFHHPDWCGQSFMVHGHHLGTVTEVRVHARVRYGVIAHSTVNECLSRFLDTSARLVRVTDSSNECLDDPTSGKKNFADAGSFTIVTEPSFAELRRHVAVGLNINQFRPTIVIDGNFPAWTEYGWVGRSLRIGGIEGVCLRVRQRKKRCSMIEVDQLMGERLPAAESLRTLAALNESDLPGAYFGVEAEHLSCGTIGIGAAVEFLD